VTTFTFNIKLTFREEKMEYMGMGFMSQKIMKSKLRCHLSLWQ